ncbi:MAG: AAA-associated domain-containing protein [Fervidicoccaceae archaeon]
MNEPKEYVLPVSPKCISLDHVVGLVETIYSLGGKADASFINDVTDVDIDVLTHAIDLSEIFGLIRYKDGDIVLTDLGIKASRTHLRELKQILRENALKIHPVSDILEKASQSEDHSVTEEEIYEILGKYYSESELGKALRCVMQWIYYLELGTWDYEDGELLIKRNFV